MMEVVVKSVVSNMAEITKDCDELEREEICSEKESESKMKPRFSAEGIGNIGYAVGKEREGLIILDVCCGRPMNRYSV